MFRNEKQDYWKLSLKSRNRSPCHERVCLYCLVKFFGYWCPLFQWLKILIVLKNPIVKVALKCNSCVESSGLMHDRTEKIETR